MAFGECVSTRVPLSISKTLSARIQGARWGKSHPKEMTNHHAPLTPRSTHSTGLFKRASEGKALFFKREFRGEMTAESILELP